MSMYNLSTSNATREDVFASFNLGAQTLTMKLPIARFIDISDVPNEASVEEDEVSQRPLDKAHATRLATYILKGLVNAALNYRKLEGADYQAHLQILEAMGQQAYYSLQPIVVNIPADLADLSPKAQVNPAGDDVALRITLPPTVLLWVIDGQHRRWAMNLVLDFLRYVRANQAYPKRGSLFPYVGSPNIDTRQMEAWRDAMNLALNHCTVTVEGHLNLDVEQRRQLFHDLNNMSKGVSASMSFDFDNSNPVNMFIKDVLIDHNVLGAPVVEKDVVDWSSHDGSMARKDLVGINSILFANKTNPKGVNPVQVDTMKAMATDFWKRVASIPHFGKPGAKMKTVAAQPVVLKALAKLAYDFKAGKKADAQHLKKLLDGIPTLDFSHNNPMWHVYEFNEIERAKKLPGIGDYLPQAEGNRDIGGSDDVGHMRFGAKHNDIYPILGDIIRWKLGLPSRHDGAAVETAA